MRVRGRGHVPQPEHPRCPRGDGDPPVRERRPVWFDGAPRDSRGARPGRAAGRAALHGARARGAAGHDDRDPARRPVRGRRPRQPAHRLPARGGHRRRRVTPTGPGAARAHDIDPITFEVLNNAFRSIVDEMGALCSRAAFSLVVSEGRDYSGTICTAHRRPRLLGLHRPAGAPRHDPVHRQGHAGLDRRAGRGVLPTPATSSSINDAYIGGTHNNDVRVVMPVYHEGELIAFVQNSAHWTDIGGGVPGTFDPNAKQLARRGADHPADQARPPRRARSRPGPRAPAQRAHARDGLRRPAGAGRRRRGWASAACRSSWRATARELVLAEMEALIGYSERMLRDAFRGLADGT